MQAPSKKSILGIALFISALCVGYPADSNNYGAPSPSVTQCNDGALPELLRHGYKSQELFTLPNGINEFDLAFRDGQYYLFSHDFDTPVTNVRRARSLAGLAHAESHGVLPGLYPTVLYEDGIWHAWVYDNVKGVTVHYAAQAWDGPYERRGEVEIPQAADWHVRRNPADGMYYASYKNVDSEFAAIARSRGPEGPWTILGFVFQRIGRAPWHTYEEADPAIFFFGGRAYMTFAGWGSPTFGVSNGTQRVGIVELDPLTFQAVKPATILVEPLRRWQRRAGSNKVFNPVVFEIPGSPTRMFYAHNPSAAKVRTGWGYIESRSRSCAGPARAERR